MVGDAGRPVPRLAKHIIERQQAVATLKQGLAALFPYADPDDDPDRGRAHDQKILLDALHRLAQR